jgi:hypothetical protein
MIIYLSKTFVDSLKRSEAPLFNYQSSELLEEANAPPEANTTPKAFPEANPINIFVEANNYIMRSCRQDWSWSNGDCLNNCSHSRGYWVGS